jgi:hypothetical protein
MQETMTDQLREAKLSARFGVSIAKTVKDLLPIHEILNTYMKLPQADKSIDVGDDMEGLEDDQEPMEPMEPEELMEPEEPMEPMEPMEPEEPTETMESAEPMGEEDEEIVKKVAIFGKVPPGTLNEQMETEATQETGDDMGQDDVLFADAPDKKE